MADRIDLSDAYFQLSMAVAKQAAEDYRLAYRRFLKTGNRNRMMDEIEGWVTTDYGAIVTQHRGTDILRMIRHEEDLIAEELKGEHTDGE
jgi:hypothetical protein